MKRASKTEVWQALSDYQLQLANAGTRITDLFRANPSRSAQMSLGCAGILGDFSKHLIDDTGLELLYRLANGAGLADKIRDLFAGLPVNVTEHRPALHMALRGHIPAAMPDVAMQVNSTLAKIDRFVSRVHTGEWTGYSGQAIQTVINIGIGGSDLGPAMATEALSTCHRPGLRCLFVSNVDPAHIRKVLAGADPATTLFVVSSKSFTTLETLSNARLARAWFLQSGAPETDIHRHFVAVSGNIAAAGSFGIHPDNIFPMWDWVGGRYSLWSAIGIPITLATSMQTFRQLLAGAAAMDAHFLHTPFAQNMPVRMALLAIWYRNFWQCDSYAILPYAQDLHLLPSFLQQLDMESLGKSTGIDGGALTTDTGAVIWGSAGTNGQHSFHQLLHQGTDMIPADFIAVARSNCQHDVTEHQQLLANCLAQSRALMLGKSGSDALSENLASGMTEQQAAALAPHRVVPGNRPSTTLVLEQLDAHNLGALIALYEHKVFVQSVIWDINAFDQWGVEIGKQLSGPVFEALTGNAQVLDRLDPSSQLLIRHIRSVSTQPVDKP